MRAHRVGPLYQHVFPPAAAPALSFVGLPWKVVPFCQYELQSRWIARCLSGRAQLPDLAAMRADVAAFYARLRADGVPQRWALLPGSLASGPRCPLPMHRFKLLLLPHTTVKQVFQRTPQHAASCGPCLGTRSSFASGLAGLFLAQLWLCCWLGRAPQQPRG